MVPLAAFQQTDSEGKNPAMAYHVPYVRQTFKPVNDMLPGNETSDSPVEFDIVPAWGEDLARIKSIVYAAAGFVQEYDWTPETQAAVISAFRTGAPAFQNTVEAIRNLTIPSDMALRAGLIMALPKKVGDGGGLVDDKAAPYQVLTGQAFSMICGAVPAMALHVAAAVGKLSDKAEADPRLFKQPSGSGGTGTRSRKANTSAGTARRTSKRRGTAAKPSAKPGIPPTDTADESGSGT